MFDVTKLAPSPTRLREHNMVVPPQHCLDTACRIERSYRILCKAITKRYYDHDPDKPLLVEMQAGLKDMTMLQHDLKRLRTVGEA
jgi:hypothetical protein